MRLVGAVAAEIILSRGAVHFRVKRRLLLLRDLRGKSLSHDIPCFNRRLRCRLLCFEHHVAAVVVGREIACDPWIGAVECDPTGKRGSLEQLTLLPPHLFL